MPNSNRLTIKTYKRRYFYGFMLTKQSIMKIKFSMILMMLLSFGLWSQSNEERLQQLQEDDAENVQAIVAFDADLQQATLEAAAQPDVLKQIQKIQDRSRAEFEGIVKPYSQETQQILWDLTRYPSLISRLANENSESTVLRDYPTVIHARAKEANRYYHNLLEKIANLERQTNSEFESLLQRYPSRTQQTFRKLIQNPEALSALAQNNRTTQVLGDLYKNDPNWTLRRFADLNRELNDGNNQALESWKTELTSNPDAVTEFNESAKAYAQEYGYDDEYYGEDTEDQVYYENNRPERVVVRNYYNYSYPYWFGYPRWYRQPRWRPVPYWYDYGFYYRPNRPIVIIQMPSYRFVNWYFYRPAHHYRYARLSACFVDFSYRYPRYHNNIYVGVERWKYRNRDIVSDNWLSDRSNRVERMREFGKLEQERGNYNRGNRGREVSQREYLAENETKYPRLREVAPRKADIDKAPSRNRNQELDAPRQIDRNTPPRTREEAHQVQEPPRRKPERTLEEPRSVKPERTEENSRRTPTSETPRRRNEIPSQSEEPRREVPRTSEPRTIERRPEPETPRQQAPERTRSQNVERSRSVEKREAPRTQERTRSNDSPPSKKSEGTPRTESSGRKRSNG